MQFGSDISYSASECALAVFTPIGSSTTPALRMKVERHVGTDSTPFSFLPSLGGGSGLRGYSDSRFGGNWSLLGNLELRQRIISLSIDEHNTMNFSLVLFGDAGQVADHLDETRWNRFHLDVGIGARISLPGGGVLRVDFARSPEGLGIQMGLGELF
ncbi:MAG: BamA/TamA family outer membrane protein [Candidatus Aegiribacteria sp.]|nr:BamA/TamA family outer membrane protein [Candidatus Aegiribacteria sp.]